MNCYCTPPNYANSECCHSNDLCNFSGNLDDVTATPIYVQSVYDAVRFHLQGMKTIQGLKFNPPIPCGCTIHRITDIRCKKFFDPCNIKDPNNLTLDMETGISGAYFLNDCNGVVETIGPDGIPSEKVLFADTECCEEKGRGTPIFGTQNVRIWGNIVVYIDLLICDNCGRESPLTICAEVNVAKPSHPLVLTNFFELCMPGTGNSAFMPRLTELANAGFSCRLATNNASRDLCIGPNGEVSSNLILAICVTCEKKITVPVQLCVLSTGFAEAPLQENAAGIVNCPGLFPERNDSGSETFSNSSSAMPNASNTCGETCSSQVSDECSCGCNDYPPQSCR